MGNDPNGLRRTVAVELESDPSKDLELVRAAVEGEETALRQLCERLVCVPRMVASLNRRVGDALTHADLDDVGQDVVSRIWQKLPEFEGRSRLETWCYRFCFLTFMNALRRHQRRGKTRPLDPEQLQGSASDGAQRLLDYDRVQEELERLPSPDAEVIRLKYFRDMSFREIASVLEVSATSAKTYFHRGMQRLRQAIG